MKKIDKGYSDFKWRIVCVACCLLLPTTPVKAAAVAFGGGAVAGCSLSDFTYTCESSPSTSVDAISIAVNYIVTITGTGNDDDNLYAFTAALGVNSVVNANLIVASTAALAAEAASTNPHHQAMRNLLGQSLKCTLDDGRTATGTLICIDRL